MAARATPVTDSSAAGSATASTTTKNSAGTSSSGEDDASQASTRPLVFLEISYALAWLHTCSDPACAAQASLTAMQCSKGFFYFVLADTGLRSSISIDGKVMGRLEIRLFADVVPKTCENFRALCTGEKGTGQSGKALHYKGNRFHRIVPHFMAQAGDITTGDGKGGESIYGGAPFQDESFLGRHARAGVVSMANRGRNTNRSQFFITFGPASWCDDQHVVFGVVSNLDRGGRQLLRQIEACGVDQSGTPIKEVVISDCGEISGDDKRVSSGTG